MSTPTTNPPDSPTTEAPAKTFWPYGLTIFIALFIVTMVSVVIYLSTIRTDLVTDDYYKQELAYQQQIDRAEAANRDGRATLNLDQTGRFLMVALPPHPEGKPLRGELHLYRPSDSRLDRIMEVRTNAGGKQNLDVTGCQAGRWVAKLTWSTNGKDYYQETDLTLRGN